MPRGFVGVVIGGEFLREMKRDPRVRQIPVVVLPNSTNEDDVFRAYDLGANAYISKPVGFDALVVLMRCVQEFWLGHNYLPPSALSRR